MLIGVIVCGLIEDYAINLVQSIEHMSEKNDVKCVIIPIKFIGLDYEKVLNSKYGYCYNSSAYYGLLSCFDGLIIEMASVLMYASEEEKQRFAAAFENIPHVFVSYDKGNVHNVAIDNQAGLTDALEYMYKNGARKYVMLGGTPNNVDSIIRKECFERFINRHKLPYSKKSYQDGSFFLPCGEEADQLIRNNMDADVVVCANDFLAKHMYKACRKVNKRPGQDISVLGFDDSQMCTTIYPSISSIRTDIIEVGKVSFDLLMEAIAKRPARKVVVPSKFILRDSICHREDTQDIIDTSFQFDDFLMPNVMFENNENLEKIRDIILVITNLLKNPYHIPLVKVLEDVYIKLDELFSCEDLNMIDWERFASVTNEKYKKWSLEIHDLEEQRKVTEIFIKFHEMILMVNHYIPPEKAYNDYMQNKGMEIFFRETMQFVRNAEANYTRYIKNVDFLGIKNAFLYLFDDPTYYIQDEKFEIPEFVNLKAVLVNRETGSIPLSKQRMRSDMIFDNEFVNWTNFSRLIALPICSDNIIYGMMLCDMKRVGFEQSDLFMNQIGSGIRMMNLRIENNRIVDNYEESVRKLKEYNITLDSMSKTDPLTGLNNRRGFYMRAYKLLGLFPNDSLSMVIGYVDMNDLKVVNDRFGHDDGDFALKSIGSVLTDFVTTYNGFGARIGGDEFAYIIIVPKGSSLEAYRNELYGAFDEFNKSSIKPYNIEVAIGDYVFEKGDALTIDDALHQADERLYFEKNARKKKSILKTM